MEKSKIERRAYHEAGHVVMACYCNRTFDFVFIDESQSDESGKGGRVVGANKPKVCKQAAYGELMIILAGSIAETKAVGGKDLLTKTHKTDFHNSLLLCIDVLKMTNEEARHAINRFKKIVKEFFNDDTNWQNVQAIAKNLMEKKKVTYKEVITILNNMKGGEQE